MKSALPFIHSVGPFVSGVIETSVPTIFDVFVEFELFPQKWLSRLYKTRLGSLARLNVECSLGGAL